MRQFRPALKKYIYELPAGTLDPNESIAACAHRELLEETGLKAKKLTKLGSIYPVPGYSTEVIHIFKAERLTMTQAQPEEYEVIETIPMTRAKVGSSWPRENSWMLKASAPWPFADGYNDQTIFLP